MISVGICFGILVLAVLIYLSRDNTQWKEMHTGLKGYHATANDHAKTSKEVQASLLDFKIKFNDRMKENEALREQIAQLHEHIA